MSGAWTHPRFGEGEDAMRNMLVRLVRDDEGQDLVEYAMLVSLIALVCVAGVGTFGSAVNQFFQGLSTQAPLGGGS
jgi:pilus assembly protein Flp/PilA